MVIFWSFGAYLAVVSVIGAAVNWCLLPIFGRGWRLFVAPGVMAHELAHALMCVVTGAPVLEIDFWKSSGGHVLHGPPRLPLVGPILIALAPLILMTLGIFILVPVFSPALADLPWVQTVPTSLTIFFKGYLASLIAAVRSFNWLSFEPWLLLYAMLNVAVTMAPSSLDLANARWALGALVIVAAGIGRLLAVSLPAVILWPPAATSLILLGVTLMAAMVIRGFFQLLYEYL